MDFSFPNVTLIYGRQGQGKSVLTSYLLNNILKPNINSYYILGRNSIDTIRAFNLENQQLTIASNDNFVYNEIDEFRKGPGVKLLIMDDIMHINFTSSVARGQVNGLLSTSRHDNMYVIICCHLMKTIGKIFRHSCHNFITFSLDEDSLEQISYFVGEKKSKLRGLRLLRYQFIYTHITGTIKKMSINTKLIE